MKKIILSSVVAASLAVSSMAEEGSSSKSGFYVGVGSYASMSGDHSYSANVDYGYTLESYGYTDYTNSYTVDTDADGSAIKIGYNSGSSRFEIAYTNIDLDVKFSSGTVNRTYKGYDFDWVKPFTDNSLKPYISLGLGVHNWENYTVSSGSTTRDRSALTYNLGAGLLYSLGMFEFDIAYKWKKYSWEDVTHTYTNYDVNYIDTETTLKGLYAGINIHF